MLDIFQNSTYELFDFPFSELPIFPMKVLFFFHSQLVGNLKRILYTLNVNFLIVICKAIALFSLLVCDLHLHFMILGGDRDFLNFYFN